MLTRPIVPATADRARITGMPAATIAPKAIARMISVIGSDMVSARLKSFSSVSVSALLTLASPNSSTRSSGWDFCTAATVASADTTLSSIVSWSPLTSNFTRADLPSGESWPWLPRSSGEVTSFTCSVRSSLVATSSIVDRN